MLKSRLIYTLLLLAMGIFHIFLVDYLSFLVFAFFFILPVISFGITLLASRGITAEIAIKKDHIPKNETIPIQLKVKTETAVIKCRISIKMTVINELLPESQTETTILLSAGRREQTIEQALSSEFCGRLDCSIKELRIIDFLGLFSFLRKTDKLREKSVFVLPAIYQLRDTNGAPAVSKNISNEEAFKNKAGEDPAEITDIREYRIGDRLSRIHWKLSDKYGNIMVKDFAEAASDDILLLFDLNCKNNELDGLMDTIRSVSVFLSEHRTAHEIEWYSSLNFCNMHNSIVQPDDLIIALNFVLSGGRQQLLPLALMNFNSASVRRSYTHIIYICSMTGLAPEYLYSLRDRLTESQIHILIVTAEATDRIYPGEKNLLNIAVPEMDLTVIDPGEIEKNLNALVL